MFDDLEPEKEQAALYVYLAFLDSKIGDISKEEYKSKKEKVLSEFDVNDRVEIMSAIVDRLVSSDDDEDKDDTSDISS